MSRKCRNCGAKPTEERELPNAGEVRVVYDCGEVEYFDMGVYQ